MIRECGAKARTNGHKPCRRIACKNGRCHLHGGKTKNTGPKTEAGKLRQKMGSWKHGKCSKETIEERRQLSKLLKDCKQLIASV